MELLNLIVDGDGKGSCAAGDVAADHEDNAELADGVGEGEHGSGNERHAREWQSNAAKDGPGRGSEDAGYFDRWSVHGSEGDDQRLDGKGQAVDHRADEKPPEGEGERVADERDERSSKSGCGTETNEKIEAEHCGRDDERKRNGRLQDATCECVAAGDPCGQWCCDQEQANRSQAGQTQGQAEGGKVHGGASLAWWGRQMCCGEENAELICGIETELRKAFLDWYAGKPAEKVTGCGLVLRGLQDHATLTDFRIAPGGKADEGAQVAEVG